MFKRLTLTAIASTVLFAATASTAAEPTKDTPPAPSAAASDAHNRNPVSIAFLAGHGEKDAFKTGIGGRIGYTLGSGLYFGGSYVSHFGTQDGPVQANVSYAGGEVGYELAAGPVIVRPYVGAGLASIYASVFVPPMGSFQGGRIEASDRRFAVWPGASVLVPIDRAFIGVDAKFLVVDSSNAFNAYGTLGVAF
jgi:hypothetical protein